MSLELAIEKKTIALEQNTAALNALIEILTRGAVPVPAPTDGNVEQEAPREEPAPKAKRARKDEAPETVETPEKVTVEVTVVDVSSVKTPAKITYVDAAAAVTQVVKLKGKEAAKAVLAGFGAANLKEVDEERFAEVIAAAEKALG